MDFSAFAGPIDPSVLYLQSTHRSSTIWENGDETPLRCRGADSSYWIYFSTPHIRVTQLLHRMGFYGVHRSESMVLDHHLITALVERWRQETHTFHLRCGETTVTLQDIAIIWGLPIDGKAVTGIDYIKSHEEWQDICIELLGFRPSLDSFRYANINVNRIRDHLLETNITDDSTEEEVAQYARSLVLLLLGGTLVPDSTGHVKLMYLTLLRDVDDVIKYSWGSAILAFLYRELCNASQVGKHVIGGPLQLLQIWVWIRFRCLAPYRRRCRVDIDPIRVDDNEELPRPPLAAWWKCKQRYTETSNHSLRIFREMLDRLAPEEFIWEPYELNHPCISELTAWGFNDICRTRSPLIFFHIVEMYRPDRVMRQFGMLQSIPDDANTMSNLHFIDRRGHNGQDWYKYHEQYVDNWNARQWNIQNGQLAHGSVHAEYQKWYEKVTRKLINRTSQQNTVEPSGYRVGDYSQLELMWNKFGEIKLHLDAATSAGGDKDMEAMISSVDMAQDVVSSVYNSGIHLPTSTSHSRQQQQSQHHDNDAQVEQTRYDDPVEQPQSSRRRTRRRRHTSEEPHETRDFGLQQFESSSEMPIITGIGVQSNYTAFPSNVHPNMFGNTPQGYESMIDPSVGCYVPRPYYQNEQSHATPFTIPMSYTGMLQSDAVVSSFSPFGHYAHPRSPRHFSPIPYGSTSTSHGIVEETVSMDTHEETNIEPAQDQARSRRQRRPRRCGTGGHL